MHQLAAEEAIVDKDDESKTEGDDGVFYEDNNATPEATSRSNYSQKSLRSQRSNRVSELSGTPMTVLRSEGMKTRITDDHEKLILLNSWKELLTKNNGRRIEVVMKAVFDRLLLIRPKTCSAFCNRMALCAFNGKVSRPASVRFHTFFIVDAITKLIDDLTTSPSTRPLHFQHISSIGQNHRFLDPYGFVADIWESFGKAFIDVIATQVDVRGLSGANRLWIIVVATLVDLLRTGYEKAPSGAESSSSNILEVPAPALKKRSLSSSQEPTADSASISPLSPPAPLRRTLGED